MKNFSIEKTSIDKCKIYQAKHIPDHRGWFSEIYSRSIYHNPVAQTNCSFSVKNTLRGIHAATFGKLVTCVHGRVLDVCVDLRKKSLTFGEHIAVELSAENMKQLYIPSDCGHAFFAYEDSLVVYSQTSEYSPLKETTHCYKDFKIKWPKAKYILSEKDSC